MKRFGRHFAADVFRHTTATVVLASAVYVTMQTFKAARRVADEQSIASALARGAREVAAQLHASWPVLCALGFAWSLLRWRRLGQDHIVAAAGVDSRRAFSLGFALASSILVAGASTLGALAPPIDVTAVRWTDGESPGIAFASARGWDWVRLGTDHTDVQGGRSVPAGRLPAAARAALDRSRTHRDPLFRWPLLAVSALLALRFSHRSPPLRAPLTIGAVIAAGFLFESLRRLASALAQDTPLAWCPPDAAAVAALAGGGLLVDRMVTAWRDPSVR